jgi:anti-sigma B factor antagonist
MSLTIETKKRMEGLYLVIISGRLDTNTSPQFEEKLTELLANRVELVTFDMEALEYISSMGLRAIFRAREAIKAQNGNIVLTKLQPQVARVFEIMHAIRHVPIFESIEEADRFFDVIQRMELEKQSESKNA